MRSTVAARRAADSSDADRMGLWRRTVPFVPPQSVSLMCRRISPERRCLSLRLLQPEAHVQLAVRRRCRGEVHAITDRAFEVILTAVHGYEGTINQFLGDGVMALFGAPIARGPRRSRPAGGAGHSGKARAAPGRHPAHPRTRLSHADRHQHGHSRGGRHRPRSPDGLHRLGRHREPGFAAPEHRPARADCGPAGAPRSSVKASSCSSEPQRAYAVTQEPGGRTRLEVPRERGLTPLIGRAAEGSSSPRRSRPRRRLRHGATAAGDAAYARRWRCARCTERRPPSPERDLARALATLYDHRARGCDRSLVQLAASGK
jgi:hypothetical protein